MVVFSFTNVKHWYVAQNLADSDSGSYSDYDNIPNEVFTCTKATQASSLSKYQAHVWFLWLDWHSTTIICNSISYCYSSLLFCPSILLWLLVLFTIAPSLFIFCCLDPCSLPVPFPLVPADDLPSIIEGRDQEIYVDKIVVQTSTCRVSWDNSVMTWADFDFFVFEEPTVYTTTAVKQSMCLERQQMLENNRGKLKQEYWLHLMSQSGVFHVFIQQ